MNHKVAYEYWTTSDYFDEKTKEELIALISEDEIKERFYKDLEFGTAGLRGVLGAGTNRMNIYTVRRATQGFANYLLQEDIDETKGVAIAYDPRNMSKEFAQETALVFNANGIKTYIYEGIRPTPQLSFTVRHLGCAAGVMVTASHNPPEYNGYKVYGPDGAQVNSPYDTKIINHVNNITDFSQIKTMGLEQAKLRSLYKILDKEMDDNFINACKEIAINPEIVSKFKNIPIVYTPIHGAGYIPIKNLLKKVGFENVHIVEEQASPNGNFPTVKYPNPEEEEVFELAIKLAKNVNAEVIIASDPDADRIGMVCKDSLDNYTKLNGNMVGVLLTEYILSQLVTKNMLPKNAAVITSIVSSDMTKVIAKTYGAECFEVFTGFKYFGQLIKKFESSNSYTFVYGFEESYGYMAGNHTRDKDSVGITMLICEMVAYFHSNNKSVIDALQEMYKKYGFFKEDTISITLKGIAGLEKIQRIMDHFTHNQPKQVNKIPVTEFRNYKTSIKKNFITNEEILLDFPKSNVLYFKLEDETWICIRPSGTEPKIKIYFGVVRSTNEDAEFILNKIQNEIMEIIDTIG